MNVDFPAPFYLYLVVFTLHFAYAAHLLKKKPVLMVTGSLKSPLLVLLILSVVNLPGLMVFVGESPYWFDWMVTVQGFLACYELFGLKKRSARWPFLLNHLLFISTFLAWKYDLLVF